MEEQKTPVAEEVKPPAVEMSDAEIASIQQRKIQERVNRASERIKAILTEERCKLDVSVTIKESGAYPAVAVIDATQQGVQ